MAHLGVRGKMQPPTLKKAQISMLRLESSALGMNGTRRGHFSPSGGQLGRIVAKAIPHPSCGHKRKDGILQLKYLGLGTSEIPIYLSYKELIL